MKFEMPDHDQLVTFLPDSSDGIAPLSSLWMWTPMIGIPSSTAHFISQRAPSAFEVDLLNKATTPSQPLILVLHCVFHFSDQGCFTDMSVNSMGERSFLACPRRKSLVCTTYETPT